MELIESKSKRDTYLLHVEGFLYYNNGGKIGSTAYWRCRRTPECNARLTTIGDANNLKIKKGTVDDHRHAPDPDEVAAEKVIGTMKRKATEHPEAPPSRIVRNSLRGVADRVLAQLPERLNLSKGVGRIKLQNIPSNPVRIENLAEIPTDFRNTLSGNSFLLYDSYEADDDEYGRILIYATPENLRNLYKRDVWFVDGTFKCAPSIFFQLFAIMGAVSQITNKGTQTIGVPFVYALLENKREVVYKKVFRIITERSQELNINIKLPSVIMSDFELGIINAAKEEFGAEKVRCCLFHLGQSVYRHVQDSGLQRMYADPDDPSIRDAARLLVALSFLPEDDVIEQYQNLQDLIPEEFEEVYNYFGKTYVVGSRKASKGRGRGRARVVPPRYSPVLWTHYHSVLQGTARTNNISEGWHNRLQVVIGKDHPSFYAFIIELKKEQADSEIILRQLQLGQKVRKGQDPKRKIVSKYNEYQTNNDVITYLKSLSYNVHM